MDTVVDNYIFIIERLGEKIEDIEEEVLENAEPAVMEKINTFKREMNYLRKSDQTCQGSHHTAVKIGFRTYS